MLYKKNCFFTRNTVKNMTFVGFFNHHRSESRFYSGHIHHVCASVWIVSLNPARLPLCSSFTLSFFFFLASLTFIDFFLTPICLSPLHLPHSLSQSPLGLEKGRHLIFSAYPPEICIISGEGVWTDDAITHCFIT